MKFYRIVYSYLESVGKGDHEVVMLPKDEVIQFVNNIIDDKVVSVQSKDANHHKEKNRDIILSILDLNNANLTVKELALKYNITTVRIHQIKKTYLYRICNKLLELNTEQGMLKHYLKCIINN